MRTMLERVTAAVEKAIDEAQPIHPSEHWEPQQHAGAIALAAIKAMREATPEMLAVAHVTWFDPKTMPHSSPGSVRPKFARLWTAQVDAALVEAPQTDIAA